MYKTEYLKRKIRLTHGADFKNDSQSANAKGCLEVVRDLIVGT